MKAWVGFYPSPRKQITWLRFGLLPINYGIILSGSQYLSRVDIVPAYSWILHAPLFSLSLPKQRLIQTYCENQQQIYKTNKLLQSTWAGVLAGRSDHKRSVVEEDDIWGKWKHPCCIMNSDPVPLDKNCWGGKFPLETFTGRTICIRERKNSQSDLQWRSNSRQNHVKNRK